MSRVRSNIKVNGRDCWTLFDTGSRNTYIVSDIANSLPTKELEKPFPAGLGGKTKDIRRMCILEALVEGKTVSTHAYIIDEIGDDEENKTIEILFGALAMQQWGIRPIPDEERLDMTYYPKEFVEFAMI